MGRNQRSKMLWKLQYKIKLFNAALVVAVIFNVFVFAMLPFMLKGNDSVSALDMTLVGLMVGAICIVTIFILLLVVILHRSLGPIVQVEKVLDRVISGDYCARVHFRKDDLLHDMEDKLNEVLAILEQEKR
jgi:signal transduction histidine kinase